MEVVITPLHYVVQDSAFTCFIVTEPHGAYRFFVSRESLNTYLEKASSSTWFHKNGFNDGMYHYVKRHTEIAQYDTVQCYRSINMDHSDRDLDGVDNNGYPLILHDLEHSYILQRMGRKLDNSFVYCLILDGTQKFGGIMAFPVTSSLYAIDLDQDSTSNFFVVRGSSDSIDGMKFTGSDSTIVPMKKIQKRFQLISYLKQLHNIKSDSDVHNMNDTRTYVLIIGEKRFVVSADIFRKERGDEWVQLVENIAVTFEHMKVSYID